MSLLLIQMECEFTPFSIIINRHFQFNPIINIKVTRRLHEKIILTLWFYERIILPVFHSSLFLALTFSLSLHLKRECFSFDDVNVVQFFARIITWRYQILIIIMTRYWLGWMQIFWRHIHFAFHCNETAWKVSRPLQKKSRKNHEFIRVAFRSNYKWEEFSLNKIIFFFSIRPIDMQNFICAFSRNNNIIQCKWCKWKCMNQNFDAETEAYIIFLCVEKSRTKTNEYEVENNELVHAFCSNVYA